MKTAKPSYKSHDYKFKVNEENYKENVINILARGGIRPKTQNWEKNPPIF
jgi:hypothetical protein